MGQFRAATTPAGTYFQKSWSPEKLDFLQKRIGGERKKYEVCTTCTALWN